MTHPHGPGWQGRSASLAAAIPTAAATPAVAAIAAEQAKLDHANHRRGELIGELDNALAVAGTDAAGQVAAARLVSLRQRRAELEQGASGLIFGRLDAEDGTVRHLGRCGIPAPEEENENADPLVLDWRTPAARPFYTATPLDPQGLTRRRHIRTQGTRVCGVDDEPLHPDAGTEDALVGEGALLTALATRRTGSMGTAVATLQAEQDAIVRAGATGPLVVQGGPGTGKTVVALHRVAYLLFSKPELASQGVLVLGPSRRFLDYIASVLPALGETAVVSATCSDLVPGARVVRRESRKVAEIKGRALWQPALTRYAEAMRPEAAKLTFTWEGEQYQIGQRQVDRALAAAAARPYHRARSQFEVQLHEHLTDAVVQRRETLLSSMEDGFEDILDRVDASLARSDDRGVRTGVTGADVDGAFTEADVDRLRAAVQADPGVAAVLADFWVDRDPATELTRLLRDPAMLAVWVPALPDAEAERVVREAPGRPADWAESDIPLLDALFELLGAPGNPGGEAQGEFVADRAAARRDWVYGHVVVDEAQELSGMQWQMVMRRCPARSVTAVGDIDQTGAPHRHTSWQEAVDPALGQRWRLARLTICYRTPREVMELTRPVLELAGSQEDPPRAIRAASVSPWEHRSPEAELLEVCRSAVTQMRQRWAGGSVGVIAPENRVAELAEALDDQVPVLPAAAAKGLEWDAALLVDPAGIAAEPRGWNGLYVALTRCTQELGQVHLESS